MKLWNAPTPVVPFNRLEIGPADFLAAMSCFWHRDPLAALQQALRELTGQPHVLLAPSGQYAIAQILTALPQQEVVMPAYLCSEVQRAARVAGKRIIYVDLAKNSVNATSAEFAKEAKPGRILLPAHVYGIPTDIEAICDLARQRDCIVIEDAVPSFGSRYNGRLLGTFGDIGVFSFQHSKRVPALRGAAIVVNNTQLVDPAKLANIRVTGTQRVFPLGVLLYAMAQDLATIPWIYRTLLQRILPLREAMNRVWKRMHADPPVPTTTDPQTINVTESSASIPKKSAPRTPYYTRDMHPYQAELALRVLARWNQIHDQVARLADTYMEGLRDSPITTFLSPGCDHGGLMRFPIAFPGRDRDTVIQLARARRLYLKVIWRWPLPEKSEYAKFPNAVWAARNVVLLPLYRSLPVDSAALLTKEVLDIERTLRSDPA